MAETINYGDPDVSWKAQELLPRELDEHGRVKKKVGLPDQRKRQAEYLRNYEQCFGHV